MRKWVLKLKITGQGQGQGQEQGQGQVQGQGPPVEQGLPVYRGWLISFYDCAVYYQFTFLKFVAGVFVKYSDKLGIMLNKKHNHIFHNLYLVRSIPC